jgi:hypothetical protein
MTAVRFYLSSRAPQRGREQGRSTDPALITFVILSGTQRSRRTSYFCEDALAPEILADARKSQRSFDKLRMTNRRR